MQQYTSSPQTPQYTRGSQPAARTPQVGPLQTPCVAWVALSQTRNLFRVCEALSMCITGELIACRRVSICITVRRQLPIWNWHQQSHCFMIAVHNG